MWTAALVADDDGRAKRGDRSRLGAALGAAALAGLPESDKAAAFAFGLIALLYLVTEELLVEAHEKPDTAWGTALFFIGFLGLATIDELL